MEQNGGGLGPVCTAAFSNHPSCFSKPVCRQNNCVFDSYPKECTLSHCVCECMPMGTTKEVRFGIECGVDCREAYGVIGCVWEEETQSCDTIYEPRDLDGPGGTNPNMTTTSTTTTTLVDETTTTTTLSNPSVDPIDPSDPIFVPPPEPTIWEKWGIDSGQILAVLLTLAAISAFIAVAVIAYYLTQKR